MEDAIASVRRFNRFFTKYVGALQNDFLDSGMRLTEARILFEIAQEPTCFADENRHASCHAMKRLGNGYGISG